MPSLASDVRFLAVTFKELNLQSCSTETRSFSFLFFQNSLTGILCEYFFSPFLNCCCSCCFALLLKFFWVFCCFVCLVGVGVCARAQISVLCINDLHSLRLLYGFFLLLFSCSDTFYVSCVSRTVLYMCLDHCLYVNMC